MTLRRDRIANIQFLDAKTKLAKRLGIEHEELNDILEATD
jgi:hypothetical protein